VYIDPVRDGHRLVRSCHARVDQALSSPARDLRHVLGTRLGQLVEAERPVRRAHVHAVERQQVRERLTSRSNAFITSAHSALS
jgi:hypothetical protein